jgi:hypothetical protein
MAAAFTPFSGVGAVTLPPGVPDAAAPTVAKSLIPASIVVGDSSTLAITFTNSQVSPVQLTADFADTLPANLVVANPANATSTGKNHPESATPGGNSVMLTDNGAGAVEIPAQGSCTISVQVTAAVTPPPNSYTDTISAGDLKRSLGYNPSPTSATLNVTSSPPTVSRLFVPYSIVLGDTSTLSITLSNTDHKNATLVDDLVDMFPRGLEAANLPRCHTAASSCTVARRSGRGYEVCQVKIPSARDVCRFLLTNINTAVTSQ